jgi:hypothetical protein
MIGGTLLEHGERWAATVDDKRTVQIIQTQLTKALEEHRGICEAISDAPLRKEFEDVFAEEVRRCEKVIKVCADRRAAWAETADG